VGLQLAKAFVLIRADKSKLASDLKGVQKETESAMTSIGSGVGARMTAMIGGLAAGFGVLKSMNLAGQFEQTTIAFETMIGSAEETKKTLADLSEFAALTPFEMPEILQAARGLIQFGELGDEMMETLEMLGNAAAGTSIPFGFLALVFNQVRGVGKLLTQDFRQLSIRGILSLQDIADHFDVTREAAQKMISTGKISFEDVRAIFKGLSEEGGRFHNLMERQSRSLLGKWSTLKDTLNIISRTLGEVLAPVAKDFLTGVITIAENIRVWVDENGNLLKSFGKQIETMIKVAAAITAVTVALKLYRLGVQAAARAQAIFMALSGPKGWAQLVAGFTIAAFAVAGVEKVFNTAMKGVEDDTDGAKKKTDELKDALDEVIETKTGIESLSSAFQSLGTSVENIPFDSLKSMDQMSARFGELEKRMFVLKEQLKAEDLIESGTFRPSLENKTSMAVKSKMWAMQPEFKELKGISDLFGGFENMARDLSDMFGSIKSPMEDWEEFERKVNVFRERGMLTDEQAKNILGLHWDKTEMGQIGIQLSEMEQEADLLSGKLTEAKVKLMEFSNIPSVTDVQISAFKDLQNHIADLKKTAELKELGNQITESLATPAEKARKEARELWDLYDEGFITPENALRGLDRLEKQMGGLLEKEWVIQGRVGFSEFGQRIQEAFLRPDDPAKVSAEESKKQTTLLDQLNKAADKIQEKMDENKDNDVVLAPPE